MATYKKRGAKKSITQSRENEAVQESTTAEVFETLDTTANKTEEWVVISLNSSILHEKPSFFNLLLKYPIAPASLGVTLGNFISSLANVSSLIFGISLLANH